MPSVKTYLLEGDHKELKDLAESLHGKCRQRRAVIVASADPPPHLIQRIMEGDQSSIVTKGWLERCILDDLHDEYVKASPVPEKDQTKAVRAWIKVRKERADAEALALKLKQLEWEASKQLIRTHGRGPLTINGVSYDPNYNGETVYYTVKKGPARPDS